MKTLYIDTSSSYLYTGIVEDCKLISCIKEDFGQDLSRVALPKIVSMFDDNNLLAKDINKIIVVDGPGSFTGIRVGLTIAKVFAWSLNIPISTITSLEAMATSINNSNEDILVPIIDARRGFVYAAIYDNEKVILKPQHIEFKELLTKLESYNNYCFITNDFNEFNYKKCDYDPDILKIVTKFVEKEDVNPHLVNPNYLKLTAAEESRM